ncbi:MAG TPA: CHASE3 domain-containing protein, partial [Isosphaeraceae bacterium]|jgi:PAS domain S-box-containing protein|nr:CHASE3 domain-containing protein [Isosphaeraceae bacterium]
MRHLNLEARGYQQGITRPAHAMRPRIRLLLGTGFTLGVAVLVINAWISVGNMRRLADNNRRVIRTTEALGLLERTLSSLKDAETGQRGFLLTGQERYLEPYTAALETINVDIGLLRRMLENSGQQERIRSLEAKVAEKLAELRETVTIRRQQGAEAAARVVLTGRGKRTMDEIRQVVGEMEERERRLLTERSEQSEAALSRAVGTFAVASIAALLVITLLYILVLRYLASRREAEETLLGQLERWQVTLASIGDAVIVTDAEGRVTFMNPVAETLCAWTRDDAAEKPLGKVFHIVNEESRQVSEDPVAKVLREGMVMGLANHTILVASDGTERPIHDSAAPVRDSEGRITGVVLVFRDDTERRRHERELTLANRRKDEFLAMLAHELRNPLASIRSAVEMFDMPGAEGHLGWARDVIDRQVQHLAHLVDDLLDVARITRGTIRLRKQLIDAYPVLNHAIEAVRPLIDDRKHRFEASIAPKTMRLVADPIRLEQIVVNLLTNAAKYTPAGGRITLSAEHMGDQIIVRVRDTGVGIAPEALPHMFDLFAQGQRSLDRTEGGLGVGLTIVKDLAELHGGSVSARSEGVGQGSEFTVRLPATDEQPATSQPTPSREQSSHQGSRILIVDDNRDLARGLAKLLRLLGHETESAHDGPSGIEAVRAYRPEVILLDIGLPGMDGYEVARRLRMEEGLRDTLIIAISGYGQEEDRRRSREAGMDHHLVKPVDVKTLMDLITQPG